MNFYLDINNTLLGKMGNYSSEWARKYKSSVYCFPTFNEIVKGIQSFLNKLIDQSIEQTEANIDELENKDNIKLVWGMKHPRLTRNMSGG